MSESQRYMYRNICIDDAQKQKRFGLCLSAHHIIERGFSEKPHINQVIWHLERLVLEESSIFGIHILLKELKEGVSSHA